MHTTLKKKPKTITLAVFLNSIKNRILQSMQALKYINNKKNWNKDLFEYFHL